MSKNYEAEDPYEKLPFWMALAAVIYEYTTEQEQADALKAAVDYFHGLNPDNKEVAVSIRDLTLKQCVKLLEILFFRDEDN